MCSEGNPRRPQRTKKNGLRFVGDELASAIPTRRGPSGVFATSGPPLSPEQITLFTGRWMSRPLKRRNAALDDATDPQAVERSGRDGAESAF